MTRQPQTDRRTLLHAAWRLTGRSWLGLRTRAAVLLAGMVLSAAKCDGDRPIIEEGLNRQAAATLGSEDRAAAAGVPSPDTLHLWRTGPRKPVELYVDLSQSMRGFLDEQFSTEPARYRNVIAIIDARLAPSPIRGFGSQVRVVGRTAAATLDDKGIYTDGNTQMEDVFPLIAADSQLGASHLIVGDGRRSDPVRANAQYARMRQLAADWIARGGTFAVAASQAPFTPVASDPSGCRVQDDADDATCPLYAFAFLAPGDEERVANALAERFQHLFVTPAPAAEERAVTFRALTQTQEISLEPAWVERPGLGLVARSRGRVATMNPLEAEIVLADADAPERRARTAALAGQEVRATVHARRLHATPGEAWEPVTGDAQQVIAGKDPFHWRFVSFGPDEERIAFRIELLTSGMPRWLGGFDAESANDALRTYGLGRLFQGFAGTGTGPVLRAYVVAN